MVDYFPIAKHALKLLNHYNIGDDGSHLSCLTLKALLELLVRYGLAQFSRRLQLILKIDTLCRYHVVYSHNVTADFSICVNVSI